MTENSEKKNLTKETGKAETATEVIHKHEPNPSHMEPFHYLNNIPGKDVRGKLIDCFQLWLQIENPEHMKSIKEIIGNLHNASLLIDDIEDSSHLRRGVPVAHSIYGVAPVINCANYVYFLALQKCHELKNEDAMNVFVAEMLNLHRGQADDIMWRDNMKPPSEEEYMQMVMDKTGGLFRLAVGLMQAFASSDKKNYNFSPLLNKLGLYFQIRDDLINLADPEYHKSKSFCEDLTEGKFSFPIIHCIHKSDDHRLISILKQRTQDLDVKQYAQRLMKECGSLVYTREKLKCLKREIIDLIACEELGGNKPLLSLLERLDEQVEKLTDISPEEGMKSSGGSYGNVSEYFK